MMTILIYVVLFLATAALGLRLLAPSKYRKIKFYFKLAVILAYRWVVRNFLKIEQIFTFVTVVAVSMPPLPHGCMESGRRRRGRQTAKTSWTTVPKKSSQSSDS